MTFNLLCGVFISRSAGKTIKDKKHQNGPTNFALHKILSAPTLYDIVDNIVP